MASWNPTIMYLKNSLTSIYICLLNKSSGSLTEVWLLHQVICKSTDSPKPTCIVPRFLLFLCKRWLPHQSLSFCMLFFFFNVVKLGGRQQHSSRRLINRLTALILGTPTSTMKITRCGVLLQNNPGWQCWWCRDKWGWLEGVCDI